MAILIQMKTGNFLRLMVRNLSWKCARKEEQGCCVISLVAGTFLELWFATVAGVGSVTCVV